MRQHNFILAAWCGAVLAAGAFPARAQDVVRVIPSFGQPPRNVTPERGDMSQYLARMNYDAAQSGPLIVVAPERDFALERSLPGADKPAPALGSIATAFGRKIVNVGRLTVLAPKEMTVINTAPDKARLMANLQGDESFRYLFSTLSDAQWAKACGDGVSIADMTPEQRPFFDKLLPPRLRIRKYTVGKVETSPNSRSISYEGGGGDPIEIDRNQMRLRFAWSTSLQLKSADKNQSFYFGGSPFENLETGQTVYMREYSGNEEQDRSRAYGVPIIAKIPNRLKHGDLDFAATALNPLVALPEEAKTVGDIVKAVGAALNLEILADRRVAALPAFVRVAPGTGVRAGDILEGLAWSVAGAFRRMDSRMFLLTYDVEGIGTQWMRVKQWADEAQLDKWRQLEKGIEQTSKRLSLSPLRFAPDDPRALTPDLVAKIQGEWLKGEMWKGVEVDSGGLPGPLQTELKRTAKSYENSENSVRVLTDRVNLNLQMRGQWIPPGGEKIEGLDRFSLDSSTLVRFLNGGKRPDPPRPTADAPKANRYFDPKLTRRILIISPDSAKAAQEAVTAAKKAGFTEIWIPKTLDKLDDASLAPLTAAIAAGKKAQTPVYAVASLLKNSGVGELDRNLVGLTGEEWAEQEKARLKRRRALEPAGAADWTEYQVASLNQQRGWIAPTSEVIAEVARRAAKLAGTPGLSGLVLRDSTPPGYYVTPNAERYGFIEPPSGGMGYIQQNRLAFVRSEGIDPVDIMPSYIGVNVDMTLPFFPTDDFQPRYKWVNNQSVKDTSFTPPPTLWAELRDKQCLTLLTEIYNAVRKVAPTLPLYQDDRLGEMNSPSPFFASFDAADQIPRRSNFDGDAEALQAARAAAKTVLLRMTAASFALPGISPAKRPEQFSQSIGWTSAQAAKSWDGLTVDVSILPFTDALPLLSGIEPTPR